MFSHYDDEIRLFFQLTLQSALNPLRNLTLRYPSELSKGTRPSIMSAKIQFAVNAMIRAAIIVVVFWTIRTSASPTRLLTLEASVNNLALTAPLR